MLVKAKRDFNGYLPIYLTKGSYYVVYAIDRKGDKTEYLVLKAGLKSTNNDVPRVHFFPDDEFDIVADRVSSTWITKKIAVFGDSVEEYEDSSFPEYFENDLYIRASNWDLEDSDYAVIIKYKMQYEEIYSDLIGE